MTTQGEMIQPAPAGTAGERDSAFMMMCKVNLQYLNAAELQELLLKIAEVQDLRTAHGIADDQHLGDASDSSEITEDEVFHTLHGFGGHR